MASSYHHVTRDIRFQIYALKSIGQSLRQIALSVGRDQSTISREISRNTGGRGYRFKQADEKAIARRRGASRAPKTLTEALQSTLRKNLLEDWSHEQISGRLKLGRRLLGKISRASCHEIPRFGAGFNGLRRPWYALVTRFLINLASLAYSKRALRMALRRLKLFHPFCVWLRNE